MTCIERKINLRGNYPQKWCSKLKKEIGYHRWIYEQHHGPIPKGLVVRHRCDNPYCINIEHLELGTQKDNMRDKVQRGRQNPTQGELHGCHKLTAQDVLYIRSKHNVISKPKLAQQFNVTVSTIQDIQYRKSWRHI